MRAPSKHAMPMIRLTFHGAAQTVTGSKYLLEADGARILIDCGLFQGLKSLRLKNWAAPPFEPRRIHAVLITHAHIDHTGYLPRLGKQGFRQPVFATAATRDLSRLLLLDAARNQEEDAAYANRKGFSKHRPALPLFDSRDARAVLKHFKTIRRGHWFSPHKPIWVRYHDAGHLLGSNWLEVEIRQGPRPMRLLFSGDVGRYNAPLYHDPQPPTTCDYLICESTYGNRDHPSVNVLDALAEIVNDAIDRGGVMLIASFAVGRAQQLIYLLQVLMHERRIPRIPIYLDSPMAVDATDIFRKYQADHDLSEGELTGRDRVLDGPNLRLIRTSRQSKALNRINGPAVIISSSGMMTGGRILHHLKHRLPDERTTIVLGGFMAAGTRGRHLQEGVKTLRMHGIDVPVRAKVVSLSALSGHADRHELLRWLEPLAAPKKTFITHGEPEAAEAMAQLLRAQRSWSVVVPTLHETHELEVPA